MRNPKITNRTPPGPNTGGFTIVELLVVITVIAVLATIVYAFFGRATALARLTLCKDRLQTVGTGLNLYASANRLFYPVTERLSSQVGDKYANYQPELIDGLYPDYVSSREIFYCPGDVRPEFEYSQENLDAKNIGYFYYSCRTPPTNMTVSQFLWRRSGVKWPRKMHRGMDPDMWILSDCWMSGAPTPHYNYRRGVVYLKIDGTVDMVSEQPRSKFK